MLSLNLISLIAFLHKTAPGKKKKKKRKKKNKTALGKDYTVLSPYSEESYYNETGCFNSEESKNTSLKS